MPADVPPVSPPPIDPGILRRLGADKVQRRLAREAERARKAFPPLRLAGREISWIRPTWIIRQILLLPGLHHWARHAAHQIRVEQVEHFLPGWPTELEGFRLLQLTDVHLDVDPALVDTVVQTLAGLEYDLVAVTGDFRDRHDRPAAPVAEFWAPIQRALRAPAYGVLGNHDPLALAQMLEALGLQMLMNEHAVIEQRGARFCLCGVDDNYTYQTHDFAAAVAGAPPELVKILLLHAPLNLKEAARHGFALTLCGHTHGGQICLPGGIALDRAGVHDDAVFEGRWTVDHMQGYTSRGTGMCLVPARIFAPPEITLHILRRPPAGS